MSDSLFTTHESIIGQNRAKEQAMGTERSSQARRVAESLLGMPHDTYAKRIPPVVDPDLTSIEVGLISAQARAAGIAGLIDSDPLAALLVADIESAIERVMMLKAIRTA